MAQSKRIARRAVLWNTASGLINAGQSALILVFISYYLSQSDAGLFTIAYALGNLFSTMGKYGVRNYQVTDVNENCSFRDYRSARLLTALAATAALLLYLLARSHDGSYSQEKIAVILTVCLWKMIDTIEDVYYGMYQQRGRLDIGAACYTIRLLLSTLLFCLLVVRGASLLSASLAVLGLSTALAVLLIVLSARRFRPFPGKTDARSVREILKLCFPLFVGTSLSIYVGNSPKYLIDWLMDEQAQAIFGYVMMPAFVILVLNQFIYQPIIRDLGEMWQNGERRRFRTRVLRQYLIVAAITAVVIAGGVWIGIPLLSLLYNLDLSPYRAEFAVILLGGGMYALVSFIMVPITAMRLQRCISWGFLAASVLSVLIGRPLILAHGIMGAAILYLVLNTILAVYFTVYFLYKGKQLNGTA